MEKKKKSKKKSEDTCLITELENQSIICGWKTIDECASALWSGIHSTLLEGTLVFAFKNTLQKSDLVQLVVVRNIRHDIIERFGNETFAVGTMKKGWTSLNPIVDLEWLKTTVTQDLEEAPEEVKSAWKTILQKLETPIE